MSNTSEWNSLSKEVSTRQGRGFCPSPSAGSALSLLLLLSAKLMTDTQGRMSRGRWWVMFYSMRVWLHG